MTTTATGTLAERAMLVSLRRSAWGVSKLDKDATEEVARIYGADADSGRYNKDLVDAKWPVAAPLLKVRNILGKAYAAHKELTLPWMDNGTRILPSAMFFKYTSTMSAIEDELEAAKPALEMAWPAIVAEAATRRNGLFKSSDYPTSDQIGKRFRVGYRMLPLPDAADFRKDLGDDILAVAAAQTEATVREAFANATQHLYGRIFDSVKHIAEKLRGYTGTAKGSFRDSLVDNLKELVELLPALNVTNDVALTAMTTRIQNELLRYDPETLRDSDNARERTANAADDILKAVSEFMA